MNRSALTRTGAVLLLAGALGALTACGGGAPSPTSTPTTAPTGTTAPEPSTTPTSEPPAQADPTCDTIIPPDVVSDLNDAGWTFQEDVFRVGATEIDGGITCTWGDAKVASDNVQMYGWAPLAAAEATQQENALVAEGWQREASDDGVYVTENPDTAVNTDDDGYGWTYLFGDGWVKFADTKQGLILVEWPPAG